MSLILPLPVPNTEGARTSEQDAHCSMLRWKALTERKKSDRSPLQLMKATIFKWKSTYKLDRTQLLGFIELHIAFSVSIIRHIISLEIVLPRVLASVFRLFTGGAFTISNSRRPNNLFDYSSLTMRCRCIPPTDADADDDGGLSVFLHFTALRQRRTMVPFIGQKLENKSSLEWGMKVSIFTPLPFDGSSMISKM